MADDCADTPASPTMEDRTGTADLLGPMADEMPAFVALLDKDGRLLQANRPWLDFAKVWGYHADPDCRGLAYVPFCERYLHHCPDASTPVGDGLARVLAGETDRFVSEYPCPFLDGRWNRFVAKRVAGPAPAAVMVVHIDVTDLIASHRSTLLAKSKAEEAGVAKLNFMGTISHEFRTPLNIVKGFAELMQAEIHGPLGNPNYRDYVEHMLEASQQLLSHVTAVLDLQKLELGIYDVNADLCDLQATATTAIAALAQKAAMNCSRLELGVMEVTSVFADRAAMQRILTSLLENAVCHGGPGVKVRIETRIVDGGGAAVIVSDTGVGIPADQLHRVTMPFNRPDAGMANRAGRLGLGLPVAYRLARLHGGELHVFSEVGGGTTVSMTLPRERVCRSNARFRPVVVGARTAS